MSFVLPIEVYSDTKYIDLRRGYLLLIASLLEEYLIDEDINDYCDMVIAIEKSCYDHSVEIADYELLTPDFSIATFEQLYRTRVVRITKNLDVDSEVGDEYLANGLFDGSINPETISKLEDKHLSPSHNQQMIDDLTTRLNQAVSLKTSTLYRCKQCKKSETTVRSAQMRSLDESETLIIQCTWCHYKWFN